MAYDSVDRSLWNTSSIAPVPIRHMIDAKCWVERDRALPHDYECRGTVELDLNKKIDHGPSCEFRVQISNDVNGTEGRCEPDPSLFR
jgi:hypothetical protein